MGFKRAARPRRECGIPRKDMPSNLAEIPGCRIVGPFRLPAGEYYVGEMSTMLGDGTHDIYGNVIGKDNMFTDPYTRKGIVELVSGNDELDYLRSDSSNVFEDQGFFQLQDGRDVVLLKTLGTIGTHLDQKDREYTLHNPVIGITKAHHKESALDSWDYADYTRDIFTERFGQIIEYKSDFTCISYEFRMWHQETRAHRTVQIIQFGKEVVFNSTSKENECGQLHLGEPAEYKGPRIELKRAAYLRELLALDPNFTEPDDDRSGGSVTDRDGSFLESMKPHSDDESGSDDGVPEMDSCCAAGVESCDNSVRVHRSWSELPPRCLLMNRY